MTLNDVYRKYLSGLQKLYSEGEASKITSIIFESIAGYSRQDVIKSPLIQLKDSLVEKLYKCLQELLLHKPVQYVTGEALFSGIKLKVSEAVLIPRPETEELVSAATDFISQKKISVLDIGTGSGCIAIALKKNNASANITAIDISRDALEIAKENAIIQNTIINFLELNFLDENNWEKLGNYTLIISNPPYIPENERSLLDKNVSAYEPDLALFVAANEPLIFYKKITDFGKTHLKPGGRIFLETHEDYTKHVAAYFIKQDYTVVIKKDMFGKDRMIIAKVLTGGTVGDR